MIQKFHSDDFGYRPSVDKKLLALIKMGVLSGVSVLATTVTTRSIAALSSSARKHKNLTISLHVNLIEGKSILLPKEIPSLVDAQGNFYPLVVLFFRMLLGLVKKDELEREIVAQLHYLYKNDIPVTMIDSHQHTHALSPIAEVVTTVAQNHSIETIRPFGAFSNHTVKARMTYFILRMMSFATHVAFCGKFGLPATWQRKSSRDWTIMSWESNSYDSAKNDSSQTVHVVHPYLNFDSNTSYISQIHSLRK